MHIVDGTIVRGKEYHLAQVWVVWADVSGIIIARERERFKQSIGVGIPCGRALQCKIEEEARCSRNVCWMLHADLQVQTEVSTFCHDVFSQASLPAGRLPPADAQPATCYELLCTFTQCCMCPCAHRPALKRVQRSASPPPVPGKRVPCPAFSVPPSRVQWRRCSSRRGLQRRSARPSRGGLRTPRRYTMVCLC